MRRIPTCLLLAFLIIPGLKAQHNELPFQIGVLFGPAFNVGKTQSSGDTTLLRSYAKTGINATVTLTYHFPNSIFGIFGMGSWQKNPMDSKEFAQQFVPSNPGPVTVTVYSHPLNTWIFLAGPDIKLPIGKDNKFRVEFSVGGGALFAIVPDYSMNSIQYDGDGSTLGETEFRYGGILPPVFCYQLNSGLNYQLNRFWSLVFNASYTHSTPSYKDDFEIDYIKYHYTTSYPVRSLNILAGISYSF